MNPMEKAQAWNFIEEELSKIGDPVLANSIRGYFQARAEAEWGYCPAVKKVEVKVELNEDERKYLQQIKIAQTFGILPKGFGKETRDAKYNMYQHIMSGGTLFDIPENIRTPEITDLYYQTLKSIGNDALESANYFINKRRKNNG